MGVPPPAVVLSTHTTGLALIRSLGESGIPVAALFYDDRDMGFVSRYARQRFRVPHPETREAEFLSRLIELAPRLEHGLLLPADDATLVTVSRHKPLLSQHYRVACTDWAVTEKFITKTHTYEIAHAAGIPAPKTVTPAGMEEAAWLGREIEYPCLVKPCESHRFYDRFHAKLFKARCYGELLGYCRQAFAAGLPVMLQEYIPGEDALGVNYNSYVWDRRVIAEFTASKVRQAPPGSGVPCVVVSRRVPEVVEYGRAVLAAMGFDGFSCMEFKRDPRDGVYKLLEVNGRHNRSGLLAWKCGVHFPLIQYEHRIYGRLPQEAPEFEEGVYWIDLFKDLFEGVRCLRRGGCSAARWVRPYLGRKVFATIDRADLRPFGRQTAGLALRVLRLPLQALKPVAFRAAGGGG